MLINYSLNKNFDFNFKKVNVNNKNVAPTIPYSIYDSKLRQQQISSNNYLVNFKGFNSVSADYQMPMCTSFFRDINTLSLATETIKKNFPDGAAILDYACSDGEEAISILALLDGDDENKYDIIGLDKSSSALIAAARGRYREAVGYGDEAFLFNTHENVISKNKLELKKRFLKIMDETTRTDNRVDGYRVKDAYKNKIKFESCEKGDIFDISKIETEKPVGAIFFRNAFYQLFGKDFDPDDRQELNEVKPAIVDLMTEICNKLEPGGIFVSGSCYKDTQINNYISYYFQRKMPGLFIPLNNQNNPKEAPTVWMKVK